MFALHKKHNAVLLLEDGRIFSGSSIGLKGLAYGEICFSTGITGYQHTLTDPSFADQIISFTFPHIGNVGINEFCNERDEIHAAGLVIRELSEEHHYLSKIGMDRFLKENKIPGIAGLDTRALTSHIREYGHKNSYIIPVEDFSSFDPSVYKFQKYENVNYISKFQDSDRISIKNNGKYNIVIVDFGLKAGIVSSLTDIGCDVRVICGNKGFADEIIKIQPDGVLLSNGPGDPKVLASYASEEIRKIIDLNFSIFGICMGHQLLSLAIYAETVKMKNGHRGANHPVIDIETGIVEITSQNHGYVVDEKTLPDYAKVTHISLFDKSVEGIKLFGKNIFSVQYHPEGSPGTHDSRYLFKRFINGINKVVL